MITSVWRLVGFLLISSTLSLTACKSGTIYKKSTLGDIDTLSVDARQRLAFVADYNGRDNRIARRVLCTEPSPDAIVARAAAVAAGGSASPVTPTGQSAGTFAGTISGSSTEAAASIGLRTQTIQLLRDGYFYACQGVINGYVDADDYGIILANLDATMLALAAVDTLGGTTQAPAVAITAGTANASGAAAAPGAVTGPGGLEIGTITQGSGTMGAEQANAIREIALWSLNNSRRREEMIYDSRRRKDEYDLKLKELELRRAPSSSSGLVLY